MLIAKSDGTTEEFNSKKLVNSLERAGASESTAQSITKDIEKELWSGISTQEIYSRAFAQLRESRKGIAARYGLKRAVQEFGPSGFPFESYIAALFEAEGYDTQIDQIVQGKCVPHEVDVVRKKGNEITYVEAKFHNTPGFKTDLKVVLYVKARIDDIGGKGLVVTNTKFTSVAVQYSECQLLELLAWDYPQGKTLHDRIEEAALYPVTALTTLSTHEKTALLKDRIVLCTALPKETEAMERAGVRGAKANAVLEEVGALCVPRSVLS
jgi:hypothetical protein